MHKMDSIIYLEKKYQLNTVPMRNRPRRGFYLTTKGGWNMFNNPEQSEDGSNAMKEEEKDPDCQDRFIFTTFTALKDNLNAQVTIDAKAFSKYPEVEFATFGGANALKIGVVVLASLSAFFN